MLIDHRAYRFKAERSLRRKSGATVNRKTIDLKDLVLGQIPDWELEILSDLENAYVVQ